MLAVVLVQSQGFSTDEAYKYFVDRAAQVRGPGPLGHLLRHESPAASPDTGCGVGCVMVRQIALSLNRQPVQWVEVFEVSQSSTAPMPYMVLGMGHPL